MKMSLWSFLSGNSQFAPKWIDKLPEFILPISHGEYFQWLGIKINSKDSLGGETLFMFLKRKYFKNKE